VPEAILTGIRGSVSEAGAIRSHGIELRVADIPDDLRERLTGATAPVPLTRLGDPGPGGQQAATGQVSTLRGVFPAVTS